MTVSVPSDQIRAAQYGEHHHGTQRRHQEPLVKIGVENTGISQDEAEIEIHEVDHLQEVVVRAGILDVGQVRILFVTPGGGGTRNEVRTTATGIYLHTQTDKTTQTTLNPRIQLELCYNKKTLHNVPASWHITSSC